MRKNRDIRLIWETYKTQNENLQSPPSAEEMLRKFKQEGVENVQRIKNELSRCPNFNADQFDMIHSILVEEQYEDHIPHVLGTFTLEDNKYDPTHRNDTVKFRALEMMSKDIFIRLSLHIVYDLKGDCSIKTAKWSLQIPESINAGAVNEEGDITSELKDSSGNKLRLWRNMVFDKAREYQLNPPTRGADLASDWDF